MYYPSRGREARPGDVTRRKEEKEAKTIEVLEGSEEPQLLRDIEIGEFLSST